MFLSFLAAVLTGILISQSARVWLLLVIVLGVMLATLATGWNTETAIAQIAGRAIGIGIAMQLGYALGLFGSVVLGSRRTLVHDPIGAGLYSGRGADQNDTTRR